MAPSRHDRKIVDWDIKPQHKQTKLLGSSGVIFHFFDEFFVGEQNSPRWGAAFAVSHLGLFCLLMSHKKDARVMLII